MMQVEKRRKVLCPVEKKGGKTYWMNIGAAFVNRDGSLNVHLDAYPSNGKLQIRELDERDIERLEGKGARTPANPTQNAIPF